MILFIFVFAFIIPSIIFAIVFPTSLINYKNKKRNDFVKNNSIALSKLIELNDKYKFYDVKNYKDGYTYDNEIYYNMISCEDYLIYQLQFYENFIMDTIKNIEHNKKTYVEYYKEVSEINEFGVYKNNTDEYNKKDLNIIEKKLFKERILTPNTEFYFHIILYCSTINGRKYLKKEKYFSSKQMETFIKRLKDKYRSYYNDRGIWDAICRVERGKVSNKMRFSIYKRDHYKCKMCGRSTKDLEIDHIKPIAKGGKSTYDNLQTLCKRCNQAKGDTYWE